MYFYDVNGKSFGCELDRDTYNKVADSFKMPLLQMDKAQYQIIDFDWAVDFAKRLHVEKDKIREMTTVRSAMPDVPQEMDNVPTNNQSVETLSKRKALFCRKCGAKLLPDSLFCSYCGTKVVY